MIRATVGINFKKNLPIVPITDLTIKDNSLIVATQGRSIWILDDLTVLHQLSQSSDEAKLYKPKDSYRMRGGGGMKSLTAGLIFQMELLFIIIFKLR